MSPVDDDPRHGAGERGSGASDGCSAVESRLEAYLDGELETEVRRHLDRHLAGCEACRRQLEVARSLQSELRALPQVSAPERVIEDVLALARTESARAAARRPGMDVSWWNRALRPASLLALAASLLVAAVMLQPRTREAEVPASVATTVSPSVDAATIDRAGAEARLALAYVSTVTRRTGLRIRDEIVGRELIGSAARGLEMLAPHTPREEASGNHEI